MSLPLAFWSDDLLNDCRHLASPEAMSSRVSGEVDQVHGCFYPVFD